MKLKIEQRNWLLSLHITSGGLWFGTALCSAALALSFRGLGSGDVLYGINVARNLMGQFIIVPAAVLSVITGVLLCSFTNWGFFKHNWLMVKQLLTLISIVAGSIWLGPWTKEMTTISEAARAQSWQNADYLRLESTVMVGGVLQTLVLIIIIVISTVKPWSRRKTSN